ncbi:MAG: hypothetical protein JWN26_367 [Candidatus Saccharibacteria bacterium]|nr:hypothetical protein [Candidatus Saccharibacteria bacterium]
MGQVDREDVEEVGGNQEENNPSQADAVLLDLADQPLLIGDGGAGCAGGELGHDESP